MMVNNCSVTEFILLGFPSLVPVQITLFYIFLMFYMLTLSGNFFIILVTSASKTLHTPMYFFLWNLSVLEIFYTSVTIPKMLLNFILGTTSIKFNACVSQVFFFIALGSIECTLLAVMAYDRYVAICNPLQYVLIMNSTTCKALVGGSLISGFLNSMVHTICTFQLSFCSSNMINQFFCDIPPLLKVACGNTFPSEVVLFTVGGAYGFGSFLSTIISYIHIISTILEIKSTEGRKKAFSTCTSHLTVVTLFFGTSFFAYLKPTSKYSSEEGKLIPVFYAVITPTLNPIIYTLRNKEFKNAFRKIMGLKF
ncbi:olfactory receptor 5V1-like [Bufo gargarizans]|uniref:olfactory receptor 5V1-like n=1 Tax=Bufo gargarizans TaxID=30331 RepID=UPI001CF1A9B1|nr:olfactory receptor 5V1-like [Bufo gargarizans]